MMKGNNECTVTGTAIRLYIRNGGVLLPAR